MSGNLRQTGVEVVEWQGPKPFCSENPKVSSLQQGGGAQALRPVSPADSLKHSRSRRRVRGETVIGSPAREELGSSWAESSETDHFVVGVLRAFDCGLCPVSLEERPRI